MSKHVIRLGHYEFPLRTSDTLPPGTWFLMRYEVTPWHLICHTNLGDYIVGDRDVTGRLHLRNEVERIDHE